MEGDYKPGSWREGSAGSDSARYEEAKGWEKNEIRAARAHKRELEYRQLG